MKKIVLVLAIILVFAMNLIPVLGASGEIQVKINNELVQFDVKPTTINNRVLVPVRAIFENLGLQVEWDETTKTVIGQKEDLIIKLPIGDTTATINGTKIQLDVPAVIINERTLVPVRFIAESIGAEVKWDDKNQVVLISTENMAYQIIEVNNVNEFIDAIGPNRKIVLKQKEYNLSRPEKEYKPNKYVRWEEEYDGDELVIQNVNNLTIEGLSKTLSSIVVEPRYVNVITFENSNDINIINIYAGHTPEKGGCTGGVFRFIDSNRINIEKSTLFGSGRIGLELFNVNDLLFNESIITDCSEAIMAIYDSKNIKFLNSRFEGNEGYYRFIDITRSSNIVFDRIIITNNNPAIEGDYDNQLFYIEESEEIYLRNSEISNNNTFFSNTYTLINIEETTFKNNLQSINEIESARYNEIGYYYLLIGEYKDSLDYFNKAIELDPKNYIAYSYKGHALLYLGRFQESLDATNTAITINPYDYFSYLTKGNALFELERYEAALENYDKAIELDMYISHAYFGRGRALFELKRYDKAQEAFKKNIQLNYYKKPEYYYHLGLTQFELGLYREAITSFNISLEIDRNYVRSIYQKSRAYAMIGYTSEAIDNLRTAISLDESYINKAKTEKAFDNIRNTEEFKSLVDDKK